MALVHIGRLKAALGNTQQSMGFGPQEVIGFGDRPQEVMEFNHF